MEATAPQNAAARQMRLATTAAVATASILIVAKLAAWLWTGSVSVLASLVDSLMDSIASLINLLAVRYSLTPADREHRFGHGKAEPLAGLAQAGFICGSAVFLVVHAADRLRYPQPLDHIPVGIGVMVFSIVLTLALLVIQRRAIRRTASTAIRADALHYTGDVAANLSVIVALALAGYGWSFVDPLMGIAVAAYIFYSAVKIGHDAFQHLMDRELSDAVKERIIAIARENPDVKGVHDLRTRQSGRVKFIQMHLELDDYIPLQQAHAIADEVEDEILRLMPDAEVIIHQDPVSASRRLREQGKESSADNE